MKERDTYKYRLKQRNKVLQSGITNDLERREQEHQRNHGKNVHLEQVGRKTTREAAREWEKKQKSGTP